MPANMGFGTPTTQAYGAAPAQSSFLQKLMAGLAGTGGMNLTEEQKKMAQQQALMSIGAQLLSASGPSTQRVSLGQALGPALLMGQQAGANVQAQAQEQQQAELQKQLITAQIMKAQQPGGGRRPLPVMSDDGTGVYMNEEDAVGKRVYSSQPRNPSSVDEYQFYKNLPPDEQAVYKSLQRQPTVPQLAIVNGVPTLVDRIAQTTKPLSTIESESAAEAAKAGAAAQAKARQTIVGEQEGTIEKKAMAAGNVNDILDLAEPLFSQSTGSGGGAMVDKGAGFFGVATEGGKGAAQLKILQAALMFAQPRMEGPQGVLDVKLYEEAAGKIGDPTVPADQKSAAAQTIRDLQAKYQGAGNPDTAPAATRRKRYNPQTGKIE